MQSFRIILFLIILFLFPSYLFAQCSTTSATRNAASNRSQTALIVVSTDNFNRAVSTNLGSPWIEVENDSAAIEIAVQNFVKVGSTAGNDNNFGFALWSNPTDADQFSEIVYDSEDATNSDTWAGPAVRINPHGTISNATYYSLMFFSSTNNIQIRKTLNQNIVDGTGIAALGLQATAINEGDIFRLQIIGNILNAFRNNVLLIGPITDTDILNGNAGLTIGRLTANPVLQQNHSIFKSWRLGQRRGLASGRTQC